MYQEPCCVSRKLPILLRHQDYAFFQTHGDVDVEKFIGAVGGLTHAPFVYFLALKEVDVYFLRLVRYHFSRDWCHGFILLTQTDQTELVRTELADVIDHVAYGFHGLAQSDAFALFGHPWTVYLQGPMMLKIEPRLCTYAAYYGSNPEVLKSVMEGFFPKLRLGKKIEPQDERIKKMLKYDFTF